MTEPWQDYQDQAAAFFRSLGFRASVEAEVTGVRGVHVADVYVEGSVYGIGLKWIVECKAWKTNVPKEKVLALLSIMQDVGADRGFLLSEKGFQSGAIRASNGTNLTLTSLEDLQDIVRSELVDTTLAKLSWRAERAQERLRKLHKKTDMYMSEFVVSMTKVFMLQAAFKDAAKNEYPCVYAINSTASGESRISASTLDDLATAAVKIIEEAEEYATRHGG